MTEVKNKNNLKKKNSKKENLNKENLKKKRIVKNKKILIILLVCILVVFLLIILFCHGPKTDKLVYNKNESFLKQKNVDGILFKNIKCSYDGKDSLIKYVIVNDTNKKIYLNNYDIVVKDKNKKHLIKIAAGFNKEIKPKEEIEQASSVVGIDLSDAYYMELKLKTKDK